MVPSLSRLGLRARSGMSMIIVTVTLSIVAVMAAVTMPNLVTYHKQQDAELTAKVLESLDSTLDRWVGFVGQAPQQLHILVLPFTTADQTCSNGGFHKKAPGQWLNFWPWSGITIIPDYGVPTPLGFIHDTLVVSGVSAGDPEMHIDSLDLDQVQLLDIAVDGSDNPTAGILRYALSTGSTAAHPLYLARYQAAVGGCF
jgi:type II secretory pathway pseudopilin PulG